MPTASPGNDTPRNAAAGVSMSRLLASCAAARAVSTPPEPVADEGRVPLVQGSCTAPAEQAGKAEQAEQAEASEPRRREAA